MKKEINTIMIPLSAIEPIIYRPHVSVGDANLGEVDYVLKERSDKLNEFMRAFERNCFKFPKEGVTCFPISGIPGIHFTQKIWRPNVPLIVEFQFEKENECEVRPLQIKMEIKKFLVEEGEGYDGPISNLVGLIGIDQDDGTPMLYRFAQGRGDTDDLIYNYSEEDWNREHPYNQDYYNPFPDIE